MKIKKNIWYFWQHFSLIVSARINRVMPGMWTSYCGTIYEYAEYIWMNRPIKLVIENRRLNSTGFCGLSFQVVWMVILLLIRSLGCHCRVWDKFHISWAWGGHDGGKVGAGTWDDKCGDLIFFIWQPLRVKTAVVSVLVPGLVPTAPYLLEVG